MEALNRYKATVLQGFQRETQKFEAALQEVLALHNPTPPQDHVALRIELDTLRAYPERVRKLEQENAELRSKLQRAAKRTDRPSQKSRTATPNPTIQNTHDQVGPRVRQEISAVDASTSSGQPVLGTSESEEASRWLRAYFEEDSDSGIAQITLWNAYASHLRSLSSDSESLLSEKDLTSLVVRVFPGACIQHNCSSTPENYIKGIKFQNACIYIQRLHCLVKEKDREYATLMEKHFKLLKKSNELKASVRSWQAYYDRVVSMPRLKRQTANGTSSMRANDERSGVYALPSIGTRTSGHEVTQQSATEHDACSGTSALNADSLSKYRTGYHVEPAGIGASGDLYRTPQLPQSNPDLTADRSCASNGSTQLTSSPTDDNKTRMAGIVPAAVVVIGDDSDRPVIISERSLKRKRRKSAGHGDIRVHEDTCRQAGSLGRPIFVKSEVGSSPVVPAKTRGLDSIHDTLDLDEVGDRDFTPMKRNRLGDFLGSNKVNINTLQNSPSVRCTRDIGNEQIGPDSSAEDLGIMQFQEDDNDVRPSSKRLKEDEYIQRLLQQHLKWRAESAKEFQTIGFNAPTYLPTPRETRVAKQHLHNQNVNSLQNRPSTKSHNSTANVEVEAAENIERPVNRMSYGETTKLLQPLTPNVRLLPRTGNQTYVSKVSAVQKRRGSDGAHILMLSEDGECDSRHRSDASMSAKQSMGSVTESSSKISTVTAIHHRLGGLLNEPSPEKPTLTRSSAIATSGRNVDEALENSTYSLTTVNDQSHGLVISLDEASSPLNTINHRGGKPREILPSVRTRPMAYIGKTHGSAREKGPLRTRPVHGLRLDDFKLNPVNNYGVDFAFDQVVRKKDQRRCLPNCTKPECCGDKFHKLVRIGGIPVPQTRSLWDSSQIDDAEHDYRLLQDYTNLDKEALESMSVAEKNMLLERAKAQKFAIEYGRHRHVHERAASPPGFWRTEMPTTQEVEIDKQKALTVEREKIEERYREAMKGSGRWMFRDE